MCFPIRPLAVPTWIQGPPFSGTSGCDRDAVRASPGIESSYHIACAFQVEYPGALRRPVRSHERGRNSNSVAGEPLVNREHLPAFLRIGSPLRATLSPSLRSSFRDASPAAQANETSIECRVPDIYRPEELCPESLDPKEIGADVLIRSSCRGTHRLSL